MYTQKAAGQITITHPCDINLVEAKLQGSDTWGGAGGKRLNIICDNSYCLHLTPLCAFNQFAKILK